MIERHETCYRYLLAADPATVDCYHSDVLVIGSGIAGLQAALKASEFGTVTIVTKSLLRESNTYYAQGGIAAALHPDDSSELHISDTTVSGKGLCIGDVVSTVVNEGVARVQELIDWGSNFDRTPNGDLAFTAEGGHSAKRILHANGDETGKELECSMLKRCQQQSNISSHEFLFVVDLITENNQCLGVIAYDLKRSKPVIFLAKSTVLATGGGGHLFRETSNPNTATGDGFALAYRAGCVLRDMEFVQFHPTTLYIAGAQRALITEAARGEGGLLINKYGHRFMPDYHPKAELAPRDVVSSSMVREMRRCNSVCVYLDLRHMDAELVQNRFPRIVRLCSKFALKPLEDLIPVRPSVHYMIGGVEVDLDAQTSVTGLLAAGEVTSSGLHGANRLGSNSLLEGLVFGYRAGQNAGEHALKTPMPNVKHPLGEEDLRIDAHINVRDMVDSLKATMWRHVGIERESSDLCNAIKNMDAWAQYTLQVQFHDSGGWTLQNMLLTARVIATAALAREESRGAHQRLDFPRTDEENWQRNSAYCWRDHGRL